MTEESVRGWWKKVCGDDGRRCVGMTEEGVRGWRKKVCGNDEGRRLREWWERGVWVSIGMGRVGVLAGRKMTRGRLRRLGR